MIELVLSRLAMARPLILSIDGDEFSVTIRKVDRDSIYGSVTIEAFDEKKNPAELMVLAADGKTLFNKGGSALAVLDKKGNSIDRRTLTPVDADGKELPTVKSSFDAPNILNKGDVDEYLTLVVKSVYWLQPYEDGDIKKLLAYLAKGSIYTFPFSYRGGIEHDDAFLIGNGKDAFVVIGKQANPQFAKLNQAAALTPVEDDEVAEDDLSFDLF